MVEKDLTFLEEITLKTKEYLDRTSIAVDRGTREVRELSLLRAAKVRARGGQEDRPVLALLSAEAVGSKDDTVMDAAVAVELLHAESIIHDDIIDQEVSQGEGGVPRQIRYSASLLTADFVFAMILAIAARYQDRRVAHTLSKAALQMCEGEYMELTVDPIRTSSAGTEYIDIIYNKTGALFQTATSWERSWAEGRNEEIEALSSYGKYLGIAYQVHDDILDWGAKDKVTLALKQGDEESSDPHEAEVSDREQCEEGEGAAVDAGRREGVAGSSWSSPTFRSRGTSSTPAMGDRRHRRPGRTLSRVCGKEAQTDHQRHERREDDDEDQRLPYLLGALGLVQVHPLHDPEVVPKLKTVLDYPGDCEPRSTAPRHGEEEEELAPEAVQRGQPRQAEQGESEGEGGYGGPLGQARRTPRRRPSPGSAGRPRRRGTPRRP